MATDTLTFIRELPKRFQEIGAVLPSSGYLARAMLRPLGDIDRPRRILEVGPGTGPFTRQVIEQMTANDSFLICEINAQFIARLQAKLAELPAYNRNKERIQFHQGAVQELKEIYPTNSFDFIVSSLPFTNFSPAVVQEILDLYEYLLADGGSLTFVEYVAVKKLAALIRSPEDRLKVRAVEDVVKAWRDRHTDRGRIGTEFTLLNVPPAVTVHLRG